MADIPQQEWDNYQGVENEEDGFHITDENLGVISESSDEEPWDNDGSDSLHDQDTDFLLIVKNSVMTRSESRDWEIISLDSVSAFSECSANSAAQEAISRSRGGSPEPPGHTDAVPDEKGKAREDTSDAASMLDAPEDGEKKKKEEVTRCGFVLFRRNCAEIAIIIRKKKKDSKKSTYDLPGDTLREKETPLEAAVRAFRHKTGCTNFNKSLAVLPQVVQVQHKSNLLIFFPALIGNTLKFEDKAKYSVEWWPTETLMQPQRKIHASMTQVINNALALFEQYRDSIPTLVDDETLEMAELAHGPLFEHALENDVSIKASEVREFLCRNQEDLETLINGASTDDLKVMLRKMIMQLPETQNLPVLQEAQTSQPVDDSPSKKQCFESLQILMVASEKKNGVLSWRKLADNLEANPFCLQSAEVVEALGLVGRSMDGCFPKQNTHDHVAILQSIIQHHLSA